MGDINFISKEKAEQVIRFINLHFNKEPFQMERKGLLSDILCKHTYEQVKAMTDLILTRFSPCFQDLTIEMIDKILKEERQFLALGNTE